MNDIEIDLDETPMRSFTGDALKAVRSVLNDFMESFEPVSDHLASSGYCLYSIYDGVPQLTHELMRLFHSSCRVADPGD